MADSSVVARSARKPRGKKTKSPSHEKKHSKTSSPTTTLTVSVLDAVAALRNNETRVVSETKGLLGKTTMETKVSYPPELLVAMRGLFPASREYEFQMHYVTTQTSTAGGSLLGSETINPSVTSFAEWSALSSLFDEVKAVSSSMRFCSLIFPTAALPPCTMVMAFDETQTTSGTPASFLSVFRLAQSKSWSLDHGDAGCGSHTQVRKMTSRSWCITSSPVSTSPIGGMTGSWVFGNSGLLGTSAASATTLMIVRTKLRNRG